MSIPLPVVIEGKPMPSKMYLKVEMKSINQSFDQFATGKTDKAEAMFVKAVQAVRKKDVAAFGSVWSAPDQMKSTGQTKVVKMATKGKKIQVVTRESDTITKAAPDSCLGVARCSTTSPAIVRTGCRRAGGLSHGVIAGRHPATLSPRDWPGQIAHAEGRNHPCPENPAR